MTNHTRHWYRAMAAIALGPVTGGIALSLTWTCSV